VLPFGLELADLLNPQKLLATFGYVGVTAIVFAESGLFFGFFLPGDSLLFTAGFLASPAGKEVFNIVLLSTLCVIAAIAGDQVGYWFGKWSGPRLFNRDDSIWFHKKHLVRAHDFYEKHGGAAIILARFLPIVRTFVPIVAGAALMDYRKFVTFNILGGLLWAVSMTWGGYAAGIVLGATVHPEHIDRYLVPIIIAIILLSFAPTALHILRERGRERAESKASLTRP
jgi:membrane-associated protein